MELPHGLQFTTHHHQSCKALSSCGSVNSITSTSLLYRMHSRQDRVHLTPRTRRVLHLDAWDVEPAPLAQFLRYLLYLIGYEFLRPAAATFAAHASMVNKVSNMPMASVNAQLIFALSCMPKMAGPAVSGSVSI